VRGTSGGLAVWLLLLLLLLLLLCTQLSIAPL
jgi:hypothetical protein